MKRTLLLVALLSLVLSFSAQAQDVPPISTSIPWGDGTRFGWGLESGLIAYQDPYTLVGESPTGFYTSPFLFWSGGPKITIAAQHIEDWSFTRYQGLVGLRWSILSAEQSSDIRVTFGVNGNIYHGGGYDYLVGYEAPFSDRLGWGFDLGGGIAMSGATAFKMRAAYDMQHKLLTARIGLCLTDAFKH